MKDTSRTGYLSELTAQRRVAELGVDLLLPVGPSTPYDFVGHLRGCFVRVQVKTARPDKDGLRFATSTGTGTSHRGLTPQDCDVILAVDRAGECYVVLPNGKEQRVLTRPQMGMAVLKDATQLFVVQGRSPFAHVPGVFWNKRLGRWIAQVTVNGKRVQNGSFSSYDEAVAMADKLRFGEEQLLRDAAKPE